MALKVKALESTFHLRSRFPIACFWMLFLLCSSRGLYWIGLAQDNAFNPPPGDSVYFDPSVRKGISSWTQQDRLVMTPYFYWYDVWSQAHLLNPDNSDALTTHPATLTGVLLQVCGLA